jgi:hypothetical protein
MEGLTWTCHVCGDERPDDKIDVFSVVENVRGVIVQQNVRYCNDRIECRAGCPGVIDKRMRAHDQPEGDPTGDSGHPLVP